jgi:hypothetical protein
MEFQLALNSKLEHQFPVYKSMAGRKWLRKILIRDPCLSLRKPESGSLVKVKGITKELLPSSWKF